MDVPMVFIVLPEQADQFERGAVFGVDGAAGGKGTDSAAGKYNQNIFHNGTFG